MLTIYQGWLNTEVGNEFFQKQRERADNATKSDERGFYDMMKEIAMEMQHKTGVLKLQSSEDRPLKVLDICSKCMFFMPVFHDFDVWFTQRSERFLIACRYLFYFRYTYTDLSPLVAPGGYAAAAKALNPTAEIYGITLGAEDGGRKFQCGMEWSSPLICPSLDHVIMDDCDLKDLVYHDVTLLVKELSDKSAPGTHPHTWSFSDDRPFASCK